MKQILGTGKITEIKLFYHVIRNILCRRKISAMKKIIIRATVTCQLKRTSPVQDSFIIYVTDMRLLG
jgi:hypothetical protein